jgi:hypothetical protein
MKTRDTGPTPSDDALLPSDHFLEPLAGWKSPLWTRE